MSARETIEHLQNLVDTLRAKIARMEQGRHKQDKRENQLRDRIAQLEQDVAALERANARLVEETIALRAEARPLLTEAEDKAGTQAMREVEIRGIVT